jgi:WD40 repeat protein/transcriptional regulator with XRE-family HTH domain
MQPAEQDRIDPTRIATRQDFAGQLSAVRQRAGLTVREVARTVGIQHSTAGGYFSGRHLPGLRQTALLAEILRACGVDEAADVARWQEALARVRRTPGPRPAGGPVPYRGLAAYQPGDAPWFHGRRALTADLVRLVTAAAADPPPWPDAASTPGPAAGSPGLGSPGLGSYGPGSPGLGSYGLGNGGGPVGVPVVVVGASGSGKSSLLRAGLIPALCGPVGVGWVWRLVVPGEAPVRRLAAALAGLLAAPVETVAAGLAAAPAVVAAQVRRRLAPSRLLLVVDQFEEVFTACEPAERARAVAAVRALAAAGAAVLGLRADFYGAATRDPALVPSLQHAQLVVGPLTEAELRAAITEPARQASADLEPGLVELLLRELAPPGPEPAAFAHEAGALPLLSHALLATWQRHQRGRLTVADYQDSGGIAGAIAQTAEDVYAGLGPGERELARRMFLRLVHVGDDTTDTRRRIRPAELAGPDTVHIGQLLDRFVAQRLLTADIDSVDIAHEALLTAWPRLRGWLDADRSGLRTHRQLTDAAHAWRESGREEALLHRGGRLAVTCDWAIEPSHQVELNPLEQEFLAASQRRDRSERAADRRDTRRLRTLLAAVTALLLLSTGLTGYLVQQRREADRQRDLAISRQVATEADRLAGQDSALAGQLALAAYRIAPTTEARSALLTTSAQVAATRVVGPPGALQAARLAPDGRTLAGAGADGRVRLWSVADPAHPVPLCAPVPTAPATVYALAFSPNGRLLAAGGADGRVRVWSVADPARPVLVGDVVAVSGVPATVYAVAFSPDGRTLATGGADGRVRLWRVARLAMPAAGIGRDPGVAAPGPQATLAGPAGYVQALAYSPDGRMLAAGSTDRTVRLWDVRRPRRTGVGRLLGRASNTVWSVAFSPDGRTVAAGSADKSVHRWRLGGAELPALAGASSWVNAVAYDPTGATLAAGSSDGAVRIWSAGGRVLLTLPSPPVTAVSYSQDARLLVTAGTDGVARLWHLPGPVLTGAADGVYSVEFTADGQRLVAAGGVADSTIRLWQVADPGRPAPVGAPFAPARPARLSGAMALRPDGRLAAGGGTDGSVPLWRLAGDRALPVAVLRGSSALVQSLTFSPDGRTLAVAGNDHTVRLWNVRDPTAPRPLAVLTGATNYTYGVAFSPDGRLVAAGSADDRVYLWDVADPAAPRPLATLTGPANWVFSVAFSPDGGMLAAASADKSVWLWDVRRPDRPVLLRTLTGPTNYVNAVAFSPDGSRLAAAAGDKSVWLWNVADPGRAHPIAALGGAGGSVLAVAFSPDGTRIAGGVADDTVRLWQIDPAAAARQLCATAGDPISAEEWAHYVTGKAYDPPCG